MAHAAYLSDAADYQITPIENNGEIVIGYQEAWRWWRTRDKALSSFEKQLRSFFKLDELYGDLWSTALSTAWEWDKENTVRDKKCWKINGGFHAFKPDSIQEILECDFFGRVALYGDVIECDYGYRAEKSRLLDVWCSSKELYESFKQHTQVRGTFKVEQRSVLILDQYGNERSPEQWLTLENLDGSPVSSQSSFHLTSLHTPWRSPKNLWQTPSLNASQYLILPSQPEWIIKPQYPTCPMCMDVIWEDAIVVWTLKGIAHLDCAFLENFSFTFGFTGWKTLPNVEYKIYGIA